MHQTLTDALPQQAPECDDCKGAEQAPEDECVDLCDDDDDDGDLAFADRPPHAIMVMQHQPYDASGHHNCLVSYAMATEDQKKHLFYRLRRKGRDEPLDYSSFKGCPCHELWVDRELVGLAQFTLFGFRLEREVYITLQLEGIFLKPRFREQGFTGLLIRSMADEAFQQILTCIMQEIAKGMTSFKVTTEADLYSFGGQAAVLALGEVIEDNCECAALSLGTSIECETISDAF